MAQFKITLKKILIGRPKNQIATAYSLGLTKPGKTTVQPDNIQTKGKIETIRHLVEVTEA